MKWGTMLVVLYIFQIAIFVFSVGVDETTTTANLGGVFTNGTVTNSSAPNVWSFIISPVDQSQSGFMATLLGIILLTGGIGIGLYFVFKSDLVLLFGFFSWMLGLGAIPIINLWWLVTSNVSPLVCPGVATTNCLVATLAGALTAGFLGLMYLFACLSWWSNRATE